jgi:hypothetical protein
LKKLQIAAADNLKLMLQCRTERRATGRHVAAATTNAALPLCTPTIFQRCLLLLLLLLPVLRLLVHPVDCGECTPTSTLLLLLLLLAPSLQAVLLQAFGHGGGMSPPELFFTRASTLQKGGRNL